MFAINREAIYPCPKDKAERIISLGEKLLQKTTDARQRENALQCLCYTYDGIDKEKALYYADMCGGFNVTRDELRTTILDGEDGGQGVPKLYRFSDPHSSNDCFAYDSKNFFFTQGKNRGISVCD